MALSWIDFINGEALSSVRAKINSFNGSVVTDVNTNTTNTITNTANILTNTNGLASIVSGDTAVEKGRLIPTATPPAHVEGQWYYNSDTETFNLQGPFPGIEVSPGHGSHIHVINNSGALIEAGMALRPDGVSGGKVQVVKALADTFEHARILGVAVQDIPDGAESAIAVSGFVFNIDTNGIALGTPVYLSDTVPGTYSEIAPDIRTQVGGVFVADATVGVLYVNLVNNQNIPTIFGGMQGQTTGNDTYSLTTSAQDIDDYETIKEVVVSVAPITGEITLPRTGEYRVHFTSAMTFTSVSSTRSVTFEFYDVTNTLIHFSYVKNIPRDATEDSVSFSYPIDEVAGNIHKIRIKSSIAMDVTFNEISYDIESVSII